MTAHDATDTLHLISISHQRLEFLIVTSELVFEHPLNEKIRTYLRVETLFNQLEQIKTTLSESDSSVQNFFRTLFDLNDVLDRCEWRSELLKDLDKQRQLFRQWANAPQIDTSKIDELVSKTDGYFRTINQHPKLSNFIKEDRLLSLIRQRLTLPGGTCSFDLPQLYFWQHQSLEQRISDIEKWVHPFATIAEVMGFLLSMLREQSVAEQVIAHGGFYQGQREGCVMLRIKIDGGIKGFPTISGHKNRFAIKFMSLEGAITNDLNFTLTCCRSFQ